MVGDSEELCVHCSFISTICPRYYHTFTFPMVSFSVFQKEEKGRKKKREKMERRKEDIGEIRKNFEKGFNFKRIAP